MTQHAGQDRFARRLGYAFRDPELLTRALTHRSASAEHNERLEFLGDGLLNFAVGQLLYERHPHAAEGDLTYMRATLVRETALAQLAERLELGAALRLGSGELRSGGFRRASILADALEAVLGAVFVDGGFAAAHDVCRRLFADAVATLPERGHMKDAKTRLQEFLQTRGRPLPQYDVQAAAGPAHDKAFTVACRLADGAEATQGQGPTRKAAEQAAAERMLALIAPEHAHA